MTHPKFSIIIPVYNNAIFIGEAIQSVLDQTYPDYELLIVNDASPDNADEVVRQYQDDRIRYIVHPENRGLAAARNTGIRNASGDWVAFLDGDDYFHPEKLAMHAEFIQHNPDIGTTYNARFELNHSLSTIREIWRPPVTVSLADLVVGYPFSPSDMIVKKEWMYKIGLFDEQHTYVGEDLDINCKLALAGCLFGGVDKALNYRRYHSGRVLKNLKSCVEDTLSPLDRVFSDPRCTADAAAVKNQAYGQHLMWWSIIAFIQSETSYGQELLRQAITFDPSITNQDSMRYLEAIITWSIMDINCDHQALLTSIFNQLPAEVQFSSWRKNWAVAIGHLIKGMRFIFWMGLDQGLGNFNEFGAYPIKLKEPMLNWISTQLKIYHHEMGDPATDKIIQDLNHAFREINYQADFQKILGTFYINQAFEAYQSRSYTRVRQNVLKAFAKNPSYLFNKGVLSMSVRSFTAF